MGALRTILCAAALTACANNPSPLDNVVGSDKLDTKKTDPWSTFTQSGATAETKDDGGGLAGFDFKGALEKIGEAIEKPGPYEAPEKSADFAEDKPHWGVLGFGGNIVEREAYSFSLFGGGGSRGSELRKTVERLRAWAKDDKLQGLLLRVE